MSEDQLRELGASVISGASLEMLPPDGEIPVIYTNSMQLKISVFDLLLDLGVNIGIENDRARVKPVARIIMSPQHAKVLASLLDTHVKAYEAAFGKIPEAAIPQSAESDH